MTTPTQRLTAPRARSFQIGVAAVAAWLLLTTSPTTAEERKFALMTAWSPKEQPSPDLVNIQEIGSLYFDNDPFNFTDSFAEYWNEVSYGDITVSGRAFGWVPLPWRYHAPGDNRPQDYIDLDRSFSYRYGVGEDVVSGQEMLLTDWNGTILFNGAPDASHADQTGVLEDASPTLPPDVAEEDLVWTPGERFLDLDADGVYDALNEVIAVDWNLGSAAELLGTTPPADPDGDPTILNSWKDTDWDDSDTLTFIENCVLSLGPPECARNDDDQPEGPGGEDCKEPPGCETPENPEPCCLPDCCEFNDKDDDGALAIAEPYEDFMRTYNPLAGPDPNPGHWPIMDPVYVNDNYPGNVDGLLEYDPLYNSTGRTNNGFYNPPDKWRERGNTKMIQDHTDAWITPDTPAPGTYPNSPVEVQGTVWYEDFWTDWYGDTSPPPNWTGRTPTMVELDTTMWRYFNPNRGALDGFGRGSAADPVQSRSNWDPMTSSPVDPFVGTIRPDDLGFYDGPVEHDDLPSSKYHRPFGLELSQGGGDQRLGEVTSPFSDSIWGHDRASHNPSVPGGGEGYLAAAGPYAINIHGGSGLDGGNVLYLEWLTWRRDGTSPTVSVLWDLTYGPHPYQGPGEDTDSDGIGDDGLALGFRDYNLDGILDQGEVRPAGSENYLIDEDPTTDNFGSATRYPWNRRRLLEDVIEALDFSVDFDPYVDANSLTSNGTSGFGGMAGIAQLLGAKGALSGLLLLPAGAVTDDELRNPSPGLYYIHNEDQPPDPNVWPPYNWSIWSHDLATDMDNEGAAGVPATDFHNGYAAHEYMHAWENLPDLYDYDVWADDPLPEQNPIGRWGIMAKGGLTHPVAILKADRGWIDPVSLNQILTPGVPKQLTLPPAEFVRTDSYYYFDNPSRARQERQWFWSAGQSFDRRMPMPGMIVLHTDRDDNAEGLPPQQSLEGHFTYYIVQADGQFDLDEAEPPFGNGNAGDAGDVFPGATSNRSLGFGTSPQSRWWDLSPTGLNVDQIEHDFFSGVTTARFTWTPLEVPSLQIVNPPGGESLPDPFTGCENKYQVNYNAFDLYGGTDVEFYWVMEDESYTPLSFPTTNPIATVTEKSPGAVFGESIDWCIDGLVPERVYHVFAKLVPGEGEQSNTENQFIMIPGRNNGDGTISGVTVDPQNAKLEAWTIVKCATLDADCNPGTAPVATQDWLVTGTISGVQKSGMLSCDPEVPNPRYAVAGQPYTTDDGEMTFTITEDASEPFECGDSFVIATTGFTTHSAGVWINVHGEITEAPTAKITADPLFGEPPLTVKFKALSEDPNNEPMTHTWDFGDGGTAAGKEVEH
ncbi:MAG: hypothetical protein GY778_26815 [bacterium]|nr:hypothetical protein [bacterium]